MSFRALLIVALPLLAGCAPMPQGIMPANPDPGAATRVILYIGDGVGTSYWTAALLTADSLAVEAFRVVGLVDTRNSEGRITDSAAGATVYATGIRTYNGAIGVGPDTLPRRTILEMAEEGGLATGLVATSTVTHATPASFAAHVPSRRMEGEIARQMARQEIDVVLGGGRSFFDGTGTDASDLLPGLRRRYVYIETAEQLRSLRMDTVGALFGLFAPGGMDPASSGRSPALAEMTRSALDLLDRDEDGFFLMVEGSQPDWRGHDNRPFAEVAAEMLDFDDAIRAGLEYQARRPETLIVVVADHETGGLAIEQDSTGAPVADYTTGSHTGAMIPLFARGPGAESFGGLLPNFRVGELLIEVVRRAARVAQAGRPVDGR